MFQQRGNTTLVFVSILMPLMAMVGSVALGFSQYLYKNNDNQKDLDNALILAASSLPDKDIATYKINSYLQDKGIDTSTLDITFKGSNIYAESKGEYNLTFFNYLNFKIPLSFKTISSSRSTPQNISILIDNSSYLSPNPFANEPWDQANWPASNYLNDNFEDLNYNLIAKSAEHLTQTCFNENYSRLKLSAIELLSKFKESSDSSIALAVAPGVTNSYREINYYGPQYEDATKELDFDASNLCASIAQTEFSNTKYQFPITNNGIETIVNVGDWNFNENYKQYLIPEEIIWSQQSSLLDESADINSIFNFITISKSGVINADSNNKVVLLMGDVPRDFNARFPEESIKNTLRDQIQNLSLLAFNAKSKLKIYYLIFSNIDLGENDLRVYLNETANEFDNHVIFNVMRIDSNSNITKELIKVIEDEQVSVLSK